MRLSTLIFVIFYLFLNSCSKEELKSEVIEEKEISLQMIDAYEEGLIALEDQDGLTAAIYELERFLKTYPDHPSTDYAYYLLGISYYDQIVDETKDLGAITKSKRYFEYIINNFPNTDYAIDSKFKLDLIEEVLASKEMYLARYYFDKQKWIPSINRFKNVVQNYNDSIFD